jgi:hypothetical protein
MKKMAKGLLEALSTKRQAPDAEQPQSWPYDKDNQNIACARCGGSTKLIGDNGSFNLESYQCCDNSCRTCMDMEVIYLSQKAGEGELRVPDHLELIQVW